MPINIQTEPMIPPALPISSQTPEDRNTIPRGIFIPAVKRD